MEFVIGNIYRFAYGNGGNNKGNPGEELGIGRFDHFIYDSSNRVTGLHFEDRYGPKIKCPTNCSYYDTYGIEYTEALNQDPIPQEVLDDYYRYFPQNTPKDLKIISNNEDTFDKGAISFMYSSMGGIDEQVTFIFIISQIPSCCKFTLRPNEIPDTVIFFKLLIHRTLTFTLIQCKISERKQIPFRKNCPPHSSLFIIAKPE